MAKYQLLKFGGVLDKEEGGSIPDSLTNADWRKYLEWVAAGNTPDPVEPDYVLTDVDLLNESDQQMIRAIDWLLEYLVGEGVVQLADIPTPLKKLFVERKAQREAVGSPQV